MKNIIFTFFILLISFFPAFAQDVIIKKNGEEIKAKVKTVSDTEVEYIAANNPDGPVYKIAKADVLLIMYANGTKDIFNESNPSKTPPRSENIYTTSRAEQRYYRYDFFDRKIPLTYLGIDYSYVKLIGNEFESPKTLFKEINTLLMNEQSKYDMKGATRRHSLPYQYAIVDKRNEAIDEKKATENQTELIRYNDLQKIVDEYDLQSEGITDGLALVLIANNLNKVRINAAYYYVVFDVASKKIVLSDLLTGRAGGSGQRNYWARSVYETINMVRDTKYRQWKTMVIMSK